MKRAQETLTKASHKLAEIMYREAQARAARHRPAAAPSPAAGRPDQDGEGEVVDAEFEDLGRRTSAERSQGTTERLG